MHGPFARIRQRLRHPLPLFNYLVLTIETHAFCAALAFFALIAFYPFSMLLLTLSRHALQWGPADGVILETLQAYYPEGKAFLVRNLVASVTQYGREMQVYSVLWILLGAAGLFIPLETAFNRLWGFPTQRPYWRNQLVGLLLTLGCVGLAVLFVVMTGGVHWAVENVVPFRFLRAAFRYVAVKIAAMVFSVAVIFLFYRFLPNGRVRALDVLPAAVCAGAVTELVRFVYVLALPAMQLTKTQGPYYISISFVLLAYFESFVLLGGAFLAAPAPPGIVGAPLPPLPAASASAGPGPAEPRPSPDRPAPGSPDRPS